MKNHIVNIKFDPIDDGNAEFGTIKLVLPEYETKSLRSILLLPGICITDSPVFCGRDWPSRPPDWVCPWTILSH